MVTELATSAGTRSVQVWPRRAILNWNDMPPTPPREPAGDNEQD